MPCLTDLYVVRGWVGGWVGEGVSLCARIHIHLHIYVCMHACKLLILVLGCIPSLCIHQKKLGDSSSKEGKKLKI